MSNFYNKINQNYKIMKIINNYMNRTILMRSECFKTDKKIFKII